MNIVYIMSAVSIGDVQVEFDDQKEGFPNKIVPHEIDDQKEGYVDPNANPNPIPRVPNLIDPNEISKYVVKIQDSNGHNITLMNTTHENKHDENIDFFEMNGYHLYQELFRIFGEIQTEILSERDLTRLMNVVMMNNPKTNCIDVGYIYDIDFRTKLEYNQLVDTYFLPKKEDKRVEIHNYIFDKLNNNNIPFLVVAKLIKDSHRCDEILREISDGKCLIFISIVHHTWEDFFTEIMNFFK